MNHLEVCIRYMRGAKSIKDWNRRREVVKNKTIDKFGVSSWNKGISFQIDGRGLVKYAKTVNGWKS